MHILVINLAEARDRRQFQHQQLQRLALEYELVPATAAADISAETWRQYSRDWQRPLKKTEVACYFSHRKAWNKVITSDTPALILEDDALLSIHTPELLTALSQRTDADLITLEVRGRKKFVARNGEAIACDSRLLRLYQDRTGAAGYILWPTGARKLLRHEQRHGISLADAHITACHDLIAYQIEPAAIIQLDQCHHYGLDRGDISALSSSTISTTATNKGGARFRLRRIYHQVTLGLRQLYLLSRSTRRFITLRKDDFHYE